MRQQPVQVTANDVAYLIEWEAMESKSKIECSFNSSLKVLSGRYGSRATSHVEKFLEVYSVQISQGASDSFVGQVTKINGNYGAPDYKTRMMPLKDVLTGITNHIAARVNEFLKQDWDDDIWKDNAACANDIMSKMGELKHDELGSVG